MKRFRGPFVYELDTCIPILQLVTKAKSVEVVNFSERRNAYIEKK